MLARVIVALLAATIVIACGCGSKRNDEAPDACLAGNPAYLRSLERAPAPVRLAGTTPISDCLVPEQDAGTVFNQDVLGAIELGYLLGAVSKGADPIHTDLVRRLNSAARFSESGGTLPASFERAFGRGYAAGRRSG